MSSPLSSSGYSKSSQHLHADGNGDGGGIATRPVPIPADAYLAELLPLAAAAGWKVADLGPSEAGVRRVWLRRGREGAPLLYVSAGIHGDEPAGPYAVLDLLRDTEGVFDGLDAVIFPMLNPDGQARGTRENINGIDINRDYKRLVSAEARGHVAALRTLSAVDAYLCLHEDYEGKGAYIFELNLHERASPTAAMLAGMARHLPIELAATIDDFPASQGVILRTEAHRHQMRDDWPEALYLSYHHADMGYTTETPSPLPLEQRVAAQVAAVRAVGDYLRAAERIRSAGDGFA
ncbi:succinylglutamate desuccinylase [Verrucomicrobia bacterium LW23]|nr:succinylglutamate desuccinylase [Verrucomicrobia bacterium LW23]